MSSSKVRVHIVLALVQASFAGFQLLTKLGFDHGLSKIVYPVYRNIIGCLIILPLAGYLERKERPRLTFSHVLHFFFLGLTAVSFGQALYLFGLDETSPTFASAFQNSIPALTFAIAAISRVEDVNLRRWDGQAKLVGSIAAGVGATLMTVYRGRLLFKSGSDVDVDHIITTSPRLLADVRAAVTGTWHLGGIYLAVSSMSFAVYYVLQARTLRLYPARVSTVCFTNAFGALQIALFTVATRPQLAVWRLTGIYQVIAVLYAGLIASGIGFSAQAWCMQKAGPVVVSAYQPLQTVIVGIVSFIFLGENFYVGSVVGAALIIFGLYLVIWGQQKHEEIISRQKIVPSTTVDKVEEGLSDPLLN